MDRDAIESLSARQLSCLRLVGEGKSTPEIAHQLGIAEGTVNGYVAEGVAKLGVANRRQAGFLVIASIRSRPPEEMPGQNLRVAELDQRQSFDAGQLGGGDVWSLTAESRFDQGRQEQRDDRPHPLNTLALIAVIVAALLIVVLALKPIVQSARDIANSVQPGRPH